MVVPGRRYFIVIGVLILALCLVVGAIGVSGFTLFRSRSAAEAEASPSEPPITPQPSQTPPAGSTVEPTFSAPAGGEIPPDIAAQMDLIEAQVIELRGLDKAFAVPRVLISPADLRQRMASELVKEYTPEEQSSEELLVTSLGLLPAGLNLRTLYLDLLSEGVSGFYDPDQKVMYIVQGTDFKTGERLTFAHEFTHALQDQHYNLRHGLKFNDKDCEHQLQRCSALQALLEGDATYTQQLWFQRYATETDLQQIQDLAGQPSPIFDASPEYLQQDFVYPYKSGLEFVISLWDKGGWQAVNAAYQNPPLSTEQIIHPDSYPDDRPRSIQMPDLQPVLGANWRLLDEDSLGEWYTYLILAYGADPAARLPLDQARLSTTGWEGDRFALFANPSAGGGAALILIDLWDTSREAGEFMDAVRTHGDVRWGKAVEDTGDIVQWETPDQVVTLLSNNTYTFWVFSPDASTNAAVAELLQTP